MQHDDRVYVGHMLDVGRRISTRVAGLERSGFVGMRHKVVHDYLDVDLDLVWEVATLEVPRLTAALERLVEG